MSDIFRIGSSGVDTAGNLIDIYADFMDFPAQFLDLLRWPRPNRIPLDQPNKIGPFAKPAGFCLY